MSIPTIAIEPCRLCDGNKCTDACDHKELIRQAADLHQFLDDKGAPRNCEDGWGPTPWSLRGRVEILLFRPSDTSQGVSEAICQSCHGSGEGQCMTWGHGPDDYEVDCPYKDCDGTGIKRDPNSWRQALEFAASTMSSNWPERCQEIVRRARAALRTAPTGEAN